MGAQQTTQQSPWSMLPEDVLLEILALVPAVDLIHRCRLVCSQWTKVIDSATLWKLKCQRAGYIKKDCQKHPKDWKIFHYLSSHKKNLLQNPCALENVRWELVVGNSRPCVGSIGHFPLEFPTHKIRDLDLKFSDNKIRCQKFRSCVHNSDAQSSTHARNRVEEPHWLLNFIFLGSSYVLYVTAFLPFGISNKICVTVCMQDKFEPTSVGKNPWILLSENPIVCTRH
ncbi:hypothetical protein AB205_0138190 [Aquarana catesbeiana]|uniref:F-box domain-containing protein n=1 Tax=Aquarana catesbeiana TaxID=8400 RepID=A0A2G9S9U0_AQUCT|nr:hypothetical protein AB205_0138190 [Aquarana catesbeiana]